MKKFIYIGYKYYHASGGRMGSVYHENTWEKTDWGILMCIAEKEEFLVRPATLEEIKKADDMLEKCKKDINSCKR